MSFFFPKSKTSGARKKKLTEQEPDEATHEVEDAGDEIPREAEDGLEGGDDAVEDAGEDFEEGGDEVRDPGGEGGHFCLVAVFETSWI